MSYDNNNVFAKILAGELPCHSVYSDDHCLAFMDLMPQSPGHTLVIPRAPAENLFDVPQDALRATIVATQNVAAAVKEAFAAEGVMIAQLNGAAAGQTVFHLHFHIIPRNQGADMTMHAKEMADGALLAEHAERIKACLA